MSTHIHPVMGPTFSAPGAIRLARSYFRPEVRWASFMRGVPEGPTESSGEGLTHPATDHVHLYLRVPGSTQTTATAVLDNERHAVTVYVDVSGYYGLSSRTLVGKELTVPVKDAAGNLATAPQDESFTLQVEYLRGVGAGDKGIYEDAAPAQPFNTGKPMPSINPEDGLPWPPL